MARNFMDYPRCRTCKHWLGPVYDDSKGCCLAIGHGYGSTEPVATEEVCDLLTSADFGCIQHSDNAPAAPANVTEGTR